MQNLTYLSEEPKVLFFNMDQILEWITLGLKLNFK